MSITRLRPTSEISSIIHSSHQTKRFYQSQSASPDRLQTTDGAIAVDIRMSRLSRNHGGSPSNQHVPEGWFSIEPSSQGPRRPRPQTDRRADSLGLAMVTNPLAELTPKRLRPWKSKKPTALAASISPSASAPRRISRSERVESSSLRISKLQQLATSPVAAAIISEEDQQQAVLMAAAAFSPSRSLRLTCISASAKRPRPPSSRNEGSRSDARAQRQQTPPTVQIPLHEIVQSFDEPVDAAPEAESNQSAITDLFLEQWLQRFDSDRKLYKSTGPRSSLF